MSNEDRTALYCEINYSIKLLSDAHFGGGITLVGGNLQGVRKDVNGLPYIPDTQIKGLVRCGAWSLVKETFLKNDNTLLERNFGKRNGGKTRGRWSYTSAMHVKSAPGMEYDDEMLQLFTTQDHIKIENDLASNLFAYEKTGGPDDGSREFIGKIYSIDPVTEMDIAFIVASIRMNDRIGQRRSRGYGKVQWNVTSIKCYIAEDTKGLQLSKEYADQKDWIDLLIKETGA